MIITGEGFTATTLAAIVGVLLGLYNIYRRWKDRQPTIKVYVNEFVDSSHSLTSDPERAFVMRGVNKGQVPVNITGYTIFSPKHMMGHSFNLDSAYISRVLPGAYCERWEYSDVIARGLKRMHRDLSGTVELICWLKDENGRMYASKPFKFNIDRALKGVRGQRVFTQDDMGLNKMSKLQRTIQYYKTKIKIKFWKKV
jgi:hypothetical protein